MHVDHQDYNVVGSHLSTSLHAAFIHRIIMENFDIGTFKYQPLPCDDSIRLLHVQPGSTGSEIYCCLEHTTLTECRNDIYDHYTALSYVWGDANDRRSIIVNGQSFNITANLAAALNDLRHESKTLRLWADAICIDQSNISERNHQVVLMGDIYTLAQSTVIYLGDDKPAYKALISDLRSNDTSETGSIDLHLVESVEDILISSPWFTRVWVYQELILSKVAWLQLGRCRLDWDEFCVAFVGKGLDSNPNITSLNGTVGSLQGRGRRVELMLNMREARHRHKLRPNSIDEHYALKRPNLLHTLLVRRGLGASNPRDLIYGHLAVVDLEYSNLRVGTPLLSELPKIIIDYSRSISDVFSDATRHIIRYRQDLDILLHIEAVDGAPRRNDLPSWVPDFSMDPSYYHRLAPIPRCEETHRRKSITKQRAGTKTIHAPWFQLVDGVSTLAISPSWKAIGAIRETSQTIPVVDNRPCESRLDTLTQVSANSQVRGEAYYSLAAFVPTYREVYHLVRHQFGEIFLPPLSPGILTTPENGDLTAVYHCVDAYLRGDKEELAYHLSKAHKSLAVLLVLYALGLRDDNILLGRRVARVASGGLAVVPAATFPGDVICYERGIGSFLVLRPYAGPWYKEIDDDTKRYLSPWRDLTPIEEIQIGHFIFIGLAYIAEKEFCGGPLTASVAVLH